MSTSTNISTTHSSNSLKTLYLLLAIVGSIVPWFWLLQDTAALMSPTLFLQRTFANHIATAWASDLLISASVFFTFVSIVLQTRYANELNRLGSSRLWVLLYIGLTFGIGLCCSLPLFLYRRELILDRKSFR
jgi:Terpene cyclase DEP1